MSNAAESYEFLANYPWREGYIPEEVQNVMGILSTIEGEEE
jgi:hypothetical protein